MISSKPLPPIPTPLSEKRSHLFPSVTSLKRKSELATDRSSTHLRPASNDTTNSAATTSNNSSSSSANAHTNTNTISSMFSFLASTTASLRGAPSASASAQSLHPPPLPSRPSSPRPPSTTSTPAAAAATTTELATKSTHLDARSRQTLVALDQRSLQHLRAIARQSISSSCLENEILWQRLFMDTVEKLAANVAEVWQQIEATADSTTADTPRASIDEATQTSKPDAKPSKASAATGAAAATASPMVDGAAGKRPSFRYRICLAKHTSSSRQCSFTAGQFKGESILLEERSTQEKRRPPKEDQASILLGGTISVSAAPDDVPKVEKILEILVFAVCSLELEAYLMRDHGVIRPESTRNILSSHETDSRHSKATTTTQNNPLHHPKRVSDMFAGLFSRGNRPVRYKKGTIQLAPDMERGSKLDSGRQHIPSNRLSGIFSPPDDLGLGEDLHSTQNYRFAKIILQVEKAIISISPDVVFPPPHLLLRLRDEEVIGPDSKRKSYTWEDVEFVAKKIGFGNRVTRSNTTGAGHGSRFATVTSSDALSNNNGTVTHSSRLPADSRAGLDHLMTNSNSLQGIFNHQSISFSYSYYWSATAAAPCIAPKLITVEYYRKEGQYEDMSLGEMIEYMCRRANSSCPDRTCGHKRMEHISTYTHGEGRINITVEQPRPDSVTDLESEEFAPFISNNKTIALWTRCKMCRERTTPKVLSRASRLYSFSKYLELLLYNQHFEPGPRPICSHTVAKDAVARCFIYRGLVVTFEYESVDLFEMRISRLQVNEDYPTMPRFQPCDLEEDTHDYSTTHSASIGPSSHVSMASLAANSDYLKESDQSALLDTTRLEIMHFYDSCKKIIVAMEEHLGETKSTSKAQYSAFKSAKTFTTVDPAKSAALNQLDELGAGWKNEEFELYDQLRHIPISRLNDVRNRFKDCIKRTLRSMESWQKEHHLAALEASGKDAIEWCLPEYAQSDLLHTFPGTSVIVREDEPSSIIASALSCVDYLSLLSAICSHDSDKEGLPERAPRPPKKDKVFTARPTLRNSRSAGSATLARRKSGSSGSEGSTAVPSTVNGSPGKGDRAESLSQDDDDGDEEEDEEEEEDSFLVVDGYQTSVKFVQVSKVDFSSLMPNGTISTRSTIGLNFGSTRHGKNSMLGFEKKSDVARPMSMLALPNPAPSIVASPVSTPYSEKDQASSFFVSPPTSRSTTPTPSAKAKNTFGYHTLTSGLSGTMKGLSLNALSEKIGSGFSSYGTASAHLEKSEKDYLNPDGTERSVREAMAIERETESTIPSPHLKARFSHGKTSFSCTVYYAAEFDTLRRRCGIHQAYVPSLSRCASWNANGGKSKSSFYKSKDDRFVVKQMVSSWNIAEKDELLKFAPKYFEYMEKSHDAPTVLAKIFGFYTFKIKNGDSGQVLKIDVLVMEHLFFNQKITRTFDLKGIQDRHAGSKAAPAGATSTTLWDGDFLEGRFNDRLLIYSHSKKIIRESLVNDTEFLAASNIMDYSLLVGVDDERKELVVGIVDFIGAYTWSKRIESRGKTTLRGAKDSVTVLPPQQYKARFREAMERYFLAVPDKWSKTAAEQEQEAKREAANTNVPSTITEGSKESTGTAEPEQTLKRKTSGYLEKMSKAILPSRTTDTAATAAAAAAKASAMALKDASHAASSDDLMDPDARVQKLPRVFHPLD